MKWAKWTRILPFVVAVGCVRPQRKFTDSFWVEKNSDVFFCSFHFNGAWNQVSVRCSSQSCEKFMPILFVI